MIDPVALTQALLRADSVTPASGAVFDVLEAALVPLGFAIDRFHAGDAPNGPVENMLATRPGGGSHLAFAGHLDVVPPGDGWTGSPWSGEVRGDLLYGRGAVDMKGAIASFVAAITRAPATIPLSLIITGDEEGPAIHGTRALIDRMAARGIAPDFRSSSANPRPHSGWATRSRSAAAARSTSGSTCRASKATLRTPISPTIRSPD